MKDLLELIKASSTSPLEAIIIVILFICALKGIYEFIKWLKKEADEWYKKRQSEEEVTEDVDKRITNLEKENKRQFDKLENIDATLQNIVATLETISNDNDRVTLTSMRSILYRLHSEFMEKGHVTLAEREMFDQCSSIYLDKKGNNVFQHKIIPEVEALPIRD